MSIEGRQKKIKKEELAHEEKMGEEKGQRKEWNKNKDKRGRGTRDGSDRRRNELIIIIRGKERKEIKNKGRRQKGVKDYTIGIKKITRDS